MGIYLSVHGQPAPEAKTDEAAGAREAQAATGRRLLHTTSCDRSSELIHRRRTRRRRAVLEFGSKTGIGRCEEGASHERRRKRKRAKEREREPARASGETGHSAGPSQTGWITSARSSSPGEIERKTRDPGTRPALRRLSVWLARPLRGLSTPSGLLTRVDRRHHSPVRRIASWDGVVSPRASKINARERSAVSFSCLFLHACRESGGRRSDRLEMLFRASQMLLGPVGAGTRLQEHEEKKKKKTRLDPFRPSRREVVIDDSPVGLPAL
ncbi:hypothetical protein VTO42DRAFT_784 [Malbranchea cinnamomea]